MKWGWGLEGHCLLTPGLINEKFKSFSFIQHALEFNDKQRNTNKDDMLTCELKLVCQELNIKQYKMQAVISK